MYFYLLFIIVHLFLIVPHFFLFFFFLILLNVNVYVVSTFRFHSRHFTEMCVWIDHVHVYIQKLLILFYFCDFFFLWSPLWIWISCIFFAANDLIVLGISKIKITLKFKRKKFNKNDKIGLKNTKFNKN